MKKVFKIVAGILVLILAFVFLFVPKGIDKKFNLVSQKSPYQVSEAGQKLYDSLEFVADMHCDALLWKRNLLERNDFGAVDIPRMLAGNVSMQAFTIVTKSPKDLNFDKNTGETDQITLLSMVQARPMKSWFNLTERALAQCKALHSFESKSNGTFRVIESKKDIRAYLKDKRENKNITAGFLGIEGMHALEGKIENVDKLYDAGVRMMSPVHFFDNKLGGSAHGVGHEGLTDFGKEVIKKMQDKNMILDVAHCSPKMVDDILEITQKPIVSSHTGVKGTQNSVRNISDEHIKGIAKTGGLISIAMFEPATGTKTPASTARAIKYCIDLVGADYVALGSDFDGAIETHTDITGLPLYVDELLKLGVSSTDISKVMGDNVKRLLLENLPE
ncbi:dipeptidase [Arcticibacterium luteifluviistationis]|uniref:Peptidase M19 n=1 Tax=Arcticibacterium luteifluviistationis TaxID=1784714 RepID=A0A2Z4GGI5_9BACT|nr:dipeptidase [Arcticibacterium luteifluviistationis]AWW00115.1 peptidase M19 [Arcticibacterium luteifluviistationis]